LQGGTRGGASEAAFFVTLLLGSISSILLGQSDVLARYLRRLLISSKKHLTVDFLRFYAKNVFYLAPEIALKKASKRRTWTPAEVRELKSLARKKTPAKKIARTLKRSEGATRQKAGSIGLSLDSRM
jgi:hypothetical protein